MKNLICVICFTICVIIFSSCEKPSTACFTASSTTVLTKQSVTFTHCATCTNCSCHNVPSDFQWNFGDGATASGSPVTHSYSAPGKYTVTLTSNDCDGDAQATTT